MGWAMLSPSRGSHVLGGSEEGVRLEVTVENSEGNPRVSTPNAMGLASKVSAEQLYDGEESRSWSSNLGGLQVAEVRGQERVSHERVLKIRYL